MKTINLIAASKVYKCLNIYIPTILVGSMVKNMTLVTVGQKMRIRLPKEKCDNTFRGISSF